MFQGISFMCDSGLLSESRQTVPASILTSLAKAAILASYLAMPSETAASIRVGVGSRGD